ncbi:MAG: hypothetical protein K0Q50_3089 [Vampirovibrio sp.]|jgi:hypothetical protein|nr:hypothetical protein [Vampirovibrio sp.]
MPVYECLFPSSWADNWNNPDYPAFLRKAAYIIEKL